MLRFLATGHSFSYLEEVDLKIHWTAISGIVIKVCDAVYDCLKDKYLQNATNKGRLETYWWEDSRNMAVS